MTNSTSKLEKIVPKIMPQTWDELSRLMALKSTDHIQIQRTMLKDPGVVVALFREFKRKSTQEHALTDCAHVISMLGTEALRNLLSSLPKLNLAPYKSPDVRTSYSRAAHAAIIAEALAKHDNSRGAGELSTAAALQNPTLIALWQANPIAATKATGAMKMHVPIETAVSRELEDKLIDVDRHLGHVWGFPQKALESLGNWDPYDKYLQKILLASHLAREILIDWHSEETELYVGLLAEHLNCSEDEANKWLKQVVIEAAHSLKEYGYPLAAYDLPSVALPEAPEPQKKQPKKEPPKEKAPEQAKQKEPEKKPKPKESKSAEKGTIEVVAPSTAKPKPEPEKPKEEDHSHLSIAEDVQKTIGETMRHLKKEAGIKRIALVMFHGDYHHIQTKMAIGGDKEDALRTMRFKIDNHHLFSLLRKKPQSIWIRPDTFDKYGRHIPEEMVESLGTKNFCAMSIFVEGKPIGVLYADGSNLNEARYNYFRKIVLKANKRLAVPHG